MNFFLDFSWYVIPSLSDTLDLLSTTGGAVTIGLDGVQNFAGVTAVRFILGMFEAGS